MRTRIAEGRKRREIDPTIAFLGQLAERLAVDETAPKHVRERVLRMHDFMQTLGGWYDQVRVLPKPTLVALMKLGGKVARFLPGAKKT